MKEIKKEETFGSIPSNMIGFNNLSKLGIDSKKISIINLIIENEKLDSFAENEYYYYWFRKDEVKLSDVYKFVQEGQMKYEIDGKSYDINSFEGVCELVTNIKYVNKIREIFGGEPFHNKKEYFLRYSKKFNYLEYFYCLHRISRTKSGVHYIISHKKIKNFKVNEKNFVKIYPHSGRSVRYISNKNIRAFVGHFNNSNQWFNLEVNRVLFNTHIGSEIYKSVNDIKENHDSISSLGNSFFRGCKSLYDVLMKLTKNKPIPKILSKKLKLSDLILLYSLVEYNEVDKIIKFLLEYHEFYEKHNSGMQKILSDYLKLKYSVYFPDHTNKAFVPEGSSYNSRRSMVYDMSPHSHDINDYVNNCMQTGKKLNLKMKSINRLLLEHDKMVSELKEKEIPEIKVNRIYPNIKSEEDFHIEKITDKKRLCYESTIQKHCVVTYYRSINMGSCCIYSFLDTKDGQRYTLEIRVHKNKKQKKQVFILTQIRGKFNALPSEEVLKRVYSVLRNNKIYTDTIEASNGGFIFESGSLNKIRPFDIDMDEQLPF